METLGKCHPMLFSGPLVRAILEGRKTVTRRPMKPQPFQMDGEWAWPCSAVKACVALEDKYDPGMLACLCPHGSPKDRIWVRETFCVEHQVEGFDHAPPHDDGRPVRWLGDDHDGRLWEQAHYRATDPAPELVVVGSDGEERPGCRWSPSLHMPRWASRLTLEVTSVKTERVQDITGEQARAEGIPRDDRTYTCRAQQDFRSMATFEHLWDGIYKDRGLGWDANPWVWAVGFKVATATEAL